MLLAWGYGISKLLLKFLINFVLSSAQQLDASILALAALARFCSPSFMLTGTLRVLHPLMGEPLPCSAWVRWSFTGEEKQREQRPLKVEEV